MTTATSLSKENLLGINFNLLTDKQINIITKLDLYDLSFIGNRLQRKNLLPIDKIPKAIEGFKKYFALATLGYRHISVPCEEVDEVWHAFLLYTKEYTEFCNELCGHYIHHCPEDSKYAVSVYKSDNLTEELYLKYYGETVHYFNSKINCNSDDGDNGANICQSDNVCDMPA